MPNIVQLAYISTQVSLLSPSAIQEILTKSIANNASIGVTGMLIYYNGTFLQVLEGYSKTVDELYSVIKRDKRHQNVITLYKNNIESANFSAWSMGFVDVEEIMKKGDKDFVKYFENTLTSESNSSELIAKVKTLIEKFQKGTWRNYIK